MSKFIEFSYKKKKILFKDIKNDYIVSKIKSSKSFYEKELLEYLESIDLGEGLIIDVGANIGNHTVFFSKILKRDVWAFEPFVDSFKTLTENVEANKLTNVTLKQLALGEMHSLMNMSLDASENPGAAYIDIKKTKQDDDSIEVAPLDSFADELDAISLIKIDVEGFEKNVLLGAKEIIKKHKPKILCECMKISEFKDIAKILSKEGYISTRVFGATPLVLFEQKQEAEVDSSENIQQIMFLKQRISQINRQRKEKRKEHLIVTTRYPSKEDIYNYVFLHSRVKAYRSKGERVIVFRLNKESQQQSHVFEGVKIVSGNANVLKRYISGGTFDTISSHLMTEKIWSIIKPFANTHKIFVWFHGAEIQNWKRREFAYTTKDKKQWAEDRTARLNDFWRNIFIDESLPINFVFVSKHFLKEVEKDLAFKLNQKRVNVIHNFIDTDFFTYKQKTEELRKKILLIRPFTSNVYANDLAVQAVAKLSKKPYFNELSFTIVGDGELFDETTLPLEKYSNVHLKKMFLPHEQIKKLHDSHGIFLVPSRMDAQGVSRDEAMSSGLVPISNRVGAIPEFVDKKSAILADPEDSTQLADGIDLLYNYPDLFFTMSEAASARVHKQAGFNNTIQKELDLLNSRTDQETLIEKLTEEKTKFTAENEILSQDVEKKSKNLKSTKKKLKKIKNSHEYKIGSITLKPLRRLYSIPLVAKTVRILWKVASRSKGVPVVRGGKIKRKDLFEPLLPTATFALRDPNSVANGKLRVAAIMDEFTYNSYRFECDLLQLGFDTWKKDIDDFDPDLVFVESAWRGKDELWRGVIGKKTKEPLHEMVSYAQNKGIPVIFWNKEDPAHTDYFMSPASMCDFIFTSDLATVPTYKLGLERDRVDVLLFASQPQLMNPIEKYDRKDKVSFAGSYYAKYKVRVKNFGAIVDGVSKHKGVDIYDRNHESDLGKNYMFPESYRKYIKGSLPFEKIDVAYKGYNYAINMNTIKNSPTMFARRVFELMASNTIVLSNEAVGVKRMFGDLTISSDDQAVISKEFKTLSTDTERAERIRALALRKVLDEHTYRDRLSYLSSVVFENYEYEGASLPSVALVSHIETAADLPKLQKLLERQTISPKKVIVITDQANLDVDDYTVITTDKSDTVTSLCKDIDYVGLISVSDYYGPEYLRDLLLATRYSSKDYIGKAAAFSYSKSDKSLKRKKRTKLYTQETQLSPSASIANVRALSKKTIVGFAQSDKLTSSTLGIDSFGYCLDGSSLSKKQQKDVDGYLAVDTGVDIAKVYEDIASEISQIRPSTKHSVLAKFGIKYSIKNPKINK